MKTSEAESGYTVLFVNPVFLVVFSHRFFKVGDQCPALPEIWLSFIESTNRSGFSGTYRRISIGRSNGTKKCRHHHAFFVNRVFVARSTTSGLFRVRHTPGPISPITYCSSGIPAIRIFSRRSAIRVSSSFHPPSSSERWSSVKSWAPRTTPCRNPALVGP